MIIGVVSDTHRDNNALKKVSTQISDTDIVIHLGDNVKDVDKLEKNYKNRIISVRGNCDFGVKIPSERVEKIAGVNIFITHGHEYDVKNGLSRLKQRGEQLKVDVVLYGHTHESNIIFENGIWFINPGSAALPRVGPKSIALIEIENRQVKASMKFI